MQGVISSRTVPWNGSSDPTNAKTMAEATTRYDALGRTTMRTQWLVAQGLIDPNDVPIAGENGVSAADGITTRTLYDANLADGIGLDSAAGISVSKPGGGNYNVNIQACLTKLADTIANGGALQSPELCTKILALQLNSVKLAQHLI